MLSNANILCCFLFIISCNNIVTAQENNLYIFRHLTTTDGLASNVVSSIIQDRNGYMWMGTANGLQKYDGYSFITYHHQPTDPTSIDEDRISNLLLDPSENIWIKCHSFGYNLFDHNTGKLAENISDSAGVLQLLRNTNHAFIDSKKNIWFFNNDGSFSIYDLLKKRFFRDSTVINKKHSFLYPNVFYDQKTGNIWMATIEGICTYNPDKNLFFDRLNNPENLSIYNLKSPVNCLFIDRENNLWISTETFRILRYNIPGRQIKEYHVNDRRQTKNNKQSFFYQFRCILQDGSGTIWMGAHNSKNAGLLRYNSQSDSFTVFTSRPSDPDNLQYAYEILSICEDRDGNIWVGTDKGVNIFNPHRQKFFTVRNDPGDSSSFPNNEVTNFLQTGNGDILVATWGGGIALLDSQFNLKKRFFNESLISPFSPEYPFSLVWSLIENVDGKIWIGCQHGHLSLFDPGNGRFINSQPGELDQKTIRNMAMDKQKNIWMALHTAIAKWDSKKNKFTRYNKFIPYKGEHNTIVFDILPDYQNNIWVATEELGLQKFDPVAEKFIESYTPQENNPYSVSSNLINSFIQLNDSMLAIGTGSGGLNLFNIHNKKFTHITTTQGLPSNAITALYLQPPDELWVTTEDGLSRINLKNFLVVNYGRDDGISSNDFSSSTRFYKMRDGHLLAGTRNGFIYFYPDSIEEKIPPENVKITGFQVFDKQIFIDSFINHKVPLTLDHKENFITIRFASLSYLSPRQITYYYQLEGIDKNWVKAGNQRFATYTDLHGGNYLFKVKCENRNGLSSSNISTLAIIIHPPFWDTWWFYGLCIIALGAITYFMYSIKINKLKIQQELRNKIARDLHDDIGSSLSGINIYSRLALQKFDSKQDDTRDLLSKISDRSDKMMDALSDIVWSFDAQNDDPNLVLAKMKEFANEMLEPQKISYSFDVEEQIHKVKLHLRIRKEVYLIYKEAINNTAKYALASHVQISLRIRSGRLVLTVSDNGTGFDTRVIIPGNGLINMKERAKKINATLVVESVKNSGTVVSLSLPIP